MSDVNQELLELFNRLGEFKTLQETALMTSVDVLLDNESKSNLTDAELRFQKSFYKLEKLFDRNPMWAVSPIYIKEPLDKYEVLKETMRLYLDFESLWLELSEKSNLTRNEEKLLSVMNQNEQDLIRGFIAVKEIRDILDTLKI